MIKYILIVLAGLLLSCTPRNRYEMWVKKELANGKRVDSLFLGLRLGMTDHQFYGQCWEMNKQGLIRQGAGNTSVHYKVDGLKAPVDMNFYPDFYHGKVWRMPVKYHYQGWAPWNLKLSADSLQIDLLEKYKEWYGPEFMEVRHPIKGSAYVRVDGNRRISISKADEQSVWVIFTDLLVEKELAESKKVKDHDDIFPENNNKLKDALGISD